MLATLSFMSGFYIRNFKELTLYKNILKWVGRKLKYFNLKAICGPDLHSFDI